MRSVICYFAYRDKKDTLRCPNIYILLLAYLVERAIFVLCQLQLPVLPCGFSSLPSVVENLTDRTPLFTHLCASLRSFKDGSLGIPGRPARM